MPHGKYTFRKSVEVLGDASPRVHSPEHLGPGPGMWVTVAELMAPSDNDGTVYIGWFGVSSRPGLEAGYEIEPGTIITFDLDPLVGDDGRPMRYDLHDLWITAVNNGDALMVVSW